MKKVLILGAGYTIKPMADYFMDKCNYQVVMATRTVSKADRVLAGRSLGKSVAWTTDNTELLDQMVDESDMVMVMIPRSGHSMVAESCIKHGKPMITTDFMHEGIMAYDEAAQKNNVLILTELGEDPGLDNMGAKQMIDMIKSAGGKVLNLTSYGAGLPAFEDNNNPFGYKFSWDPKGLMRSAVSPAYTVVDGKRIEIARKFEALRLVDVYGIGTFETYPSNDSSRYIPLFGLDENISVYKGLLRYLGWSNTIIHFLKIGLIENKTVNDYTHFTYAQFMAKVIGAGSTASVRESVAAKMELDPNDDIILRMDWLGLFSDQQLLTKKGTYSDVLVDLMLTKMSYEPGERDMIIVHNEMDVRFPDRKEKQISSMIVKGNPDGDSAMSRAVSLPAAIAARLILEGKISAKGVRMPSTPEMYEPILEEMSTFGFTFKKTVIPIEE